MDRFPSFPPRSACASFARAQPLLCTTPTCGRPASPLQTPTPHPPTNLSPRVKDKHGSPTKCAGRRAASVTRNMAKWLIANSESLGMNLRGWKIISRDHKVLPYTAINSGFALYSLNTNNKCAIKIRTDAAAKKFNLIMITRSSRRCSREGQEGNVRLHREDARPRRATNQSPSPWNKCVIKIHTDAAAKKFNLIIKHENLEAVLSRRARRKRPTTSRRCAPAATRVHYIYPKNRLPFFIHVCRRRR